MPPARLSEYRQRVHRVSIMMFAIRLSALFTCPCAKQDRWPSNDTGVRVTSSIKELLRSERGGIPVSAEQFAAALQLSAQILADLVGVPLQVVSHAPNNAELQRFMISSLKVFGGCNGIEE
jgi:hypothetical protein